MYIASPKEDTSVSFIWYFFLFYEDLSIAMYGFILLNIYEFYSPTKFVTFQDSVSMFCILAIFPYGHFINTSLSYSLITFFREDSQSKNIIQNNLLLVT